MKENWLSKINLTILIVIGVFVSAISFVYYFVLKNPYDFLLWMIYIVDFLLFIVNAYRIIDVFDLTRIVKIILTIVTMIFFLVFCQVVVFLFVDGTSIPYTKDLFFNVLRVSLFLSPSLILLIPVMAFIAEIASWAYHTDLLFESYVKPPEGMANFDSWMRQMIFFHTKSTRYLAIVSAFLHTYIKRWSKTLHLNCY